MGRHPTSREDPDDGLHGVPNSPGGRRLRWTGTTLPRSTDKINPRIGSALGLLLAATAGCGGDAPPDLGPAEGGGLRPCDAVPNCVQTRQGHPEQYPPLELSEDWANRDPSEVRRELAAAVEALPRTSIVTQSGPYLHAEARSRVLRFVDDLELYWEPGESDVAVRSESRVGRNDFGVNLRRVESLRGVLRERGVVR